MTLVNRVLLAQLLGVISLVAVQPAVAGSRVSSVSTSVDTGATHIVQANSVAITDIQVEQTVAGLALRLATSGELLPAEIYTVDNTAFADISNAVLQLSTGKEFVVNEPAAGITRVRVTAIADGQVRIAMTGVDAPPVVNISIGETGLSAISTPAAMPTQSAQTPDSESLRIVVTGEDTTDDYFVPNASTATRTDTPLRDIPQSIQVIPRQVIEDQQATGIEEVLDNVGGVTFLGNSDGRGLDFAIRGFDDVPVLRDGFRLFQGDSVEPEVANLEQIEVLKGPASVLYGQAEPGGLINLVSKQPLSEPYYNLQLQGGNREFINPSVDLSGPLSEDGRVLYRLNALYRHEDSFRDYDSSFDRFFIAPTVSWEISDSQGDSSASRTDLTINLEYANDNDPADFGTVLFGDGDVVIPEERVINNPDEIVEKDYLNVGYTLEHRFSDNWQLQNQFRYIADDLDYSVLALPFFLDEPSGTVIRAFADQFSFDDIYTFYTNIQGKFTTGPVDHTLLVGVDLSRLENESATRFSPVPEFSSPLDIFNPDYFAVPKPDAESIPIAFGNDTTTDRLGIYLQDKIDILDNLILMAGLRYDTVDRESTDVLTDAETTQYDDALTPRIGLVYQPIEPISLYANYARSFNPSEFTDASGDFLDAEEGEGFEIGVRGEIIENRLSATLAYFNITKQNVATADPVVPFASVATGEQRSQGIDFDLSGEILPGWNIIASYAYIDAEVTEDNTADIVGNRLIGIPEHSASLWTTYEIQSGDLEGLGLGLGFNFVDERQGDLANSFAAGSYFTTNVAVFYRRDNWRLGLNIDNLFDTDYIESVNGFNVRQIYPGEPLTVRASVSYTF
ncbi:MAG: TonB-dependent siderophore receptor [Cyanobacteria bacterium P01_H01_bin.105]